MAIQGIMTIVAVGINVNIFKCVNKCLEIQNAALKYHVYVYNFMRRFKLQP